MRQIGLGIQVPPLLNMARNHLLGPQSLLDEIKRLEPSVKKLRRLDLLNPEVRTARIDGISADDCALGGEPEEGVIYGIALERAQE